MKRIFFAALALVSMQAAHIQADNCCPQDECFDPCGGWSVGADFLYWNICKDNPDYAATLVSSTNELEATYQYAPIGWEPGFRVFLGKENVFCGWDFYASYTRVSADGDTKGLDDTNSTLVNTIGLTQKPAEAIAAQNNLTYQTFDVLLGYEFCFCKCQRIRPFFGIQGVKIKQQYAQVEILQSSPTLSLNAVGWQSDYKALGLELGTVYSYDLDCGVGLFTKTAVSFVAGNDDSELVDLVNNGSSIFVNDLIDDRGLCTPGLQLQVGLTYEKCWCGWDFGFRVGYEFQNWWNVPLVRRYPASGLPTSTHSTGGNLMMHGLFLGANVGF